MMYLQKYIREHSSTTVPVFMSALAQLPAITTAYGKAQKVAVFTANGEALKPMYALISEECGVNVEDNRFVIVDCMGVPGFEAVAAGEKVNVEEVTPGMVEAAKAMLKQNPHVRALLLECTELPPCEPRVQQRAGTAQTARVSARGASPARPPARPPDHIPPRLLLPTLRPRGPWTCRRRRAAEGDGAAGLRRHHGVQLLHVGRAGQPALRHQRLAGALRVCRGTASNPRDYWSRGSRQEYSRDRAPPTTPERSGTQEEYHYGQDLDDVEAAKLKNKRSNKAHQKSKKKGENQKTHQIKSGHRHTKPGETAKV